MCPAEDLMPEQHAEHEPVVLVVEDEVLIRLAVADHLRSCGFKVVEAGNGAEAQELILAGLHVDLVFSDVTMPGPMDGAALARWLHAQMPDLPVILTSGVPSSLTAAKAACANIRTLAHKPYDYGDIVSEIRAILAARA
jgi:DNA-binding NtrC family response regulator